MIFYSIEYVLFFFIVFILYWFVVSKNLKTQNILLLFANYVFYASWGYKFLFLLIFFTLFNFIIGIKINDVQEFGNKRFWFYFGVFINVVVLILFKFSDIWLERFLEFFPALMAKNNGSLVATTLAPIGISFYTFCGLAYITDVFRKKITPSRDYVEYAVFISFFPSVISGPIERASHLFPQLRRAREFEYDKAVDGLKQILWGLLKKMVIADGCAEYVNIIFNNSAGYSGSTLVLGAIFFSFQIYADFSGYSDIALGTARLLGIDLLQNFAFPYFSRDIAEFWRRWHMSLSSWFRDYIFYPLERRRIPLFGQGVNTIIVFLLTGLWHGANWTFIVWGSLNAVYFLWFLFISKSRNTPGIVAQGKNFPSGIEIFNMGITFGLTTFAWIFFRAENLKQAFVYISGMISWSIFSVPDIFSIKMLVLIIIFTSIEWMGREKKHALANLAISWPRPLRWFLYYALIFAIFYFAGTQQEFIYSQF